MEKRGDLLLDVAHNDSSFESLFKTVRDYFRPLKANLHIGLLKDKELKRISKKIIEYGAMFDKIVLFDFPTPRGSGGKLLYESLHTLPNVCYCPDFPPVTHEKGLLNVFAGSFQIIDRALDLVSWGNGEYASFLNKPLDFPGWEKIYNEAVKRNIPVLRPLSAKVLYFLIKISKPEKILEIGSGSGYSTLWISRALAGHARLLSIERDMNRFVMADTLFRKDERVEIVHMDALEYLRGCSDLYDFVFLDAQKRDYIKFLELLKKRIKKGGLLCADNFLMSGLGASGVRLLRSFNEELSTGGCFESLFVSIEDGLVIAIKK
jgi:predicted O-methyltransferase YrrM